MNVIGQRNLYKINWDILSWIWVEKMIISNLSFCFIIHPNTFLAAKLIINSKCLSLRPSISLSIRQTVRLSICPFVHLSVGPSVRWSICPLVHLSVCPYVRLSVCQYVNQSGKRDFLGPWLRYRSKFFVCRFSS